ncbi:MAG: PAS domain-containing protein, partial [Sphingomonadaceae bacterium]
MRNDYATMNSLISVLLATSIVFLETTVKILSCGIYSAGKWSRYRTYLPAIASVLTAAQENSMRQNSSVTIREYVLKDEETIVSKTDLQGNITYVNETFIRVSGFTEAELLGAPQNIVRHPDMPREAFADFWHTLKQGRAWTGMVKNRCKNGDYYWVVANAAPYLENGKVVGYTSIRVKPTRAQTDTAERAYRDIASGSGALEIHEGVAIPRTRWHLARYVRGLSLSSQLNLVFGGVALQCCLGLAASIMGKT